VVRGPEDLDLVAQAGPVDPTDRSVLVVLVLVVLAVPVVLALAALVVLVVLVVLGLVALVDLTGRVVRGRMDRAALVVLDPVVLLDPVDRAALVVLDPAVLVDLTGRVVRDRMDRVVLVVLVVLGLAGPVDLRARVGRVGLGLTDLAVPVGRPAPVVLEARVDPVDLITAGLAGRHRRHTYNAVTTTAVARSGVVRGTHRTASARPITARRPRRGKMDSAGMVDLRRERRHPTGTAHRLLAAGTDRRPPAVGTLAGTGPDAT
jgi:hypothetical protein